MARKCLALRAEEAALFSTEEALLFHQSVLLKEGFSGARFS